MKTNYPILISKEDRLEIVNDYKQYLTRFDMKYLAECFTKGIQDEKMEEMYHIIVMAAIKRKEDKNKVIHLDDATIQKLKDNYPRYNKRELELLSELAKKQKFSITSKQGWILDILLNPEKK